jgi:ABC-type branched-subunit amino acid transport system ATPase component
MIVLDQGSLLADGPPREVLRDKRVITAYLGSKWAAHA